jgi:chromosome segregation ATPase
MESPKQPSLEAASANNPSDFDTEFTAALEDVDTTLEQIRARYQEIKIAQAEKATLEKTLAELQTDLAQKEQLEQAVAELQTELEQVQEQIHTLAITLESQLWKWQDLKEPFWQFIRYFGLGFAAATLLHKLTG